MIKAVNETNLKEAATVHSRSWRASHAAICSKKFLNLHSPIHQYAFLYGEMEQGKELYLSYDGPKAVGLISLDFNTGEIATLYILPEYCDKGYGKELLDYGIKKLSPTITPWLGVLNTNTRAKSFYEHNQFTFTGKELTVSEEKHITEQIYQYTCDSFQNNI